MRQLHIIAVQPDDLVYWWELKVWLTNLRKYNLSDRARVLMWKPYDRLHFEKAPFWVRLEQEFPETLFFWYNDDENLIGTHIKDYGYIPLLRPRTLDRHFTEFPDLVNDTIYYTDCDTVFTKDPLFLKGEWIQDDVTRMSYTGVKETGYNYQNLIYLDSKIADVIPERIEQYKQANVVEGLLDIFGLDREFVDDQNQNFGGVQYLLKNVDASFWKAVFAGCIYIRRYLLNINRRFFISENKGIQSWCADLWSIQFNFWRLKIDSQTPEEMSFCWATDLIEKWDKYTIYHDAGVAEESVRGFPGCTSALFYKRDFNYINNFSTPFEDDLSFVDPKYCSKNYVKCIEEAK
jgi:hypothetical protein